jgi:hypothetical protein
VSPPGCEHLRVWLAVTAFSALGLLLTGSPFLQTAFLLACTVAGFLTGTVGSKRWSFMPHPVLCTVAGAQVGCVATSLLMGTDYWAQLEAYLRHTNGPGDLLMVILTTHCLLLTTYHLLLTTYY